MVETRSTTSSVDRREAEFVRDLAEALMAEPTFQALAAAANRIPAGPAVAGAPSEQAEQQPTVIAYREAERSVAEVCQQANRIISQILGLDFAAQARRSCCGGGA